MPTPKERKLVDGFIAKCQHEIERTPSAIPEFSAEALFQGVGLLQSEGANEGESECEGGRSSRPLLATVGGSLEDQAGSEARPQPQQDHEVGTRRS